MAVGHILRPQFTVSANISQYIRMTITAAAVAGRKIRVKVKNLKTNSEGVSNDQQQQQITTIIITTTIRDISH